MRQRHVGNGLFERDFGLLHTQCVVAAVEQGQRVARVYAFVIAHAHGQNGAVYFWNNGANVGLNLGVVGFLS